MAHARQIFEDFRAECVNAWERAVAIVEAPRGSGVLLDLVRLLIRREEEHDLLHTLSSKASNTLLLFLAHYSPRIPPSLLRELVDVENARPEWDTIEEGDAVALARASPRDCAMLRLLAVLNLKVDGQHKTTRCLPCVEGRTALATALAERMRGMERDHVNEIPEKRIRLSVAEVEPVTPLLPTPPLEAGPSSSTSEDQALVRRFCEDLARLDEPAAATKSVPSHLVEFLRSSLLEGTFPHMCTRLDVEERTDETVHRLADELLATDLGFHEILVVCRSLFLPRVLALQSPASRVLIRTLLDLGHRFPKATLEGVLLPSIQTPSRIGAPQVECVNRILKESLPPEYAAFVLRGILIPQGGSSIPQSPWTEHVVSILHTALQSRRPLERTLVSDLVLCVDANAHNLTSSVKFTNLIFCLITNYPEQAALHATLLEQTLRKCTNIMAKSALAALARLKKEKA